MLQMNNTDYMNMAENDMLNNTLQVEPINFRDHINHYNPYPIIPINIIPPASQNFDNNFNKSDDGSLKSFSSNSPQCVKSDENFSAEKMEGNKRKNRIYKKNILPFYLRNVTYNKTYSNNNNNNNNKDNVNTGNYNDNNVYIINRQSHEKKELRITEMQRKVRGLMERFTSKAKLYQVDSYPYRMFDKSCYNKLNQAMWDLYSAKVQSKNTYLLKLEFWKTLYLSLHQIFYKYGLFMVGSTMCGFATEASDIDMCLLVRPCLNDARSDALSYLQNIQSVLQQSDCIKSTELILAKVPILKLVGSEHGFEVDLNCNNAVGIRNTHLMNCYAQLDWRVRPLVIIVKLWAQANNINDAKNKTISSYSLVLMVIHYLQHAVCPPVLPCLHRLYPEKFNPYTEVHIMDIQEELPHNRSDCHQSLGELFLGFLQYYTYFNYDELAISVRQGTVLRKDDCRYNRSQKNTVTQWKLLCIEEPFDFTNTAKSVYDIEAFEHIKYVFFMSYKILNETKNLNMILPCNKLTKRLMNKKFTNRN